MKTVKSEIASLPLLVRFVEIRLLRLERSATVDTMITSVRISVVIPELSVYRTDKQIQVPLVVDGGVEQSAVPAKVLAVAVKLANLYRYMSMKFAKSNQTAQCRPNAMEEPPNVHHLSPDPIKRDVTMELNFALMENAQVQYAWNGIYRLAQLLPKIIRT